MQKDNSALFNLKRENDKLKEEIVHLHNQLLIRQDLIDKMMNILLERTQQLVQVTSTLLKITVPTKEEGGGNIG